MRKNKIKLAMDLVQEELYRAVAKFPKFNTPHEGYAVIKEELDELWDAIKANEGKQKLMNEAKQVAAMAIRFIADV